MGKALTLWQPWASLVALGVKTIETRSWSTSYRGPLAIHAAKTTAGFDALPGDCEGSIEAGWRYGYIGDFQAAYCFRSSDEGIRGETYLHCLTDPAATSEPGSCPLGAVVATCTLIEVVPVDWINWCYSSLYGAYDDENLGSWGVNRDLIGAVDPDDVEASNSQRPYGDFSRGRFAWLLADIISVDPPVSARGRQGLWEWQQ